MRALIIRTLVRNYERSRQIEFHKSYHHENSRTTVALGDTHRFSYGRMSRIFRVSVDAENLATRVRRSLGNWTLEPIDQDPTVSKLFRAWS